MNFGQVLQKASVAGCNRGYRIEDHFVEVTEMSACRKQLGSGRQNVKCVGLTPYFPYQLPSQGEWDARVGAKRQVSLTLPTGEFMMKQRVSL
jgi:hypothetical protein